MSEVIAGRRPIPPQLAETGIIAILRSDREAHLAAVAVALADAGIRCVELTMTTPGATGALRRLRPRLGHEIALGMGSVTTAEQAAAALQAGADFLVSPGVCADVARAAVVAEVECYPAGWTPTEVLAAWEQGATAVKLFPAASGGPRHLRDLRGPLPHIPLIPTGGVALEQIGEYLAAGAVAVGLGGPLIGDALEGGSPEALRRRAEGALAEARRGR